LPVRFSAGRLQPWDTDLKEGADAAGFRSQQIAPGDARRPVSAAPQNFRKIAILRSLETWRREHERAIYYMHAARIQPPRVKEIPSVGAIVAYESRDKRKDSDFLPPSSP
jgi:hypothetical protein